jgi:predicted esterase
MFNNYVFGKPDKGCIFLLPGRFGMATQLISNYYQAGLTETLMIGVQPPLEWYPQPNGAEDQDDAVKGCAQTRDRLLDHLDQLIGEFGLDRNTVALVGFSAGAVMAIQCGMEKPFGAVVGHSGAILEPKNTPACKHPTPILLTHNRHDECFKWKERFLPMKRALLRNGYNVTTHVQRERFGWCHDLTRQDVLIATDFLGPVLGYKRNRGSEQAP